MTDTAERARVVTTRIQSAVDAVTSAVSSQPRVKTFVDVGLRYTIEPGAMPSDLIRLAQGENVAAEANPSGPFPITDLTAAAPDVLRRECAGVLARELAVDAGIERMLEVLADAIVLRPFADVPPALRLLDERGLARAVVSNGDCSLGRSLEKAGLRFEVVV